MVEALLDRPRAIDAFSRLVDSDVTALHAPHLIDAEILQVLRKHVLAREIELDRAEHAMRQYFDIRIVRHSHGFLMKRVWELRSNITAYDAMYVALAEILDATLITADAALAKVCPRNVRVEVIS